MHNYRQLKVWQRSMAFTTRIYKETLNFPVDERFGLISQMRRASCSMPLNIAEGAGNSTEKEFCRFLELALRSGYEVMTAIDIARGLEYWSPQQANELQSEAQEIVAMTAGLMKSYGWPFR